MSPRIVSYKDYVAGWFDSSIHDFLEVLGPSASSTKYALITCLDSNLNPAALLHKSPELKALASKVHILGKGLLMPTELLLETKSSNRIFFGFDEVWFFPTKSIQAKPPSVSLVGPARIDRSRLKKLGKWMESNSCSLGIGGGEGLNFVIRARGLVRFVLGYSIEQPEPSFGSV